MTKRRYLVLICIMKGEVKKELAEQLYVHDNKSQKEIAVYLDTTEQTISRWKTNGRWDELRAAKTITKDAIIRNYYDQILLIQDTAKKEKRVLSSSEVDSLHKISASIKNLDNKVNLQSVIEVFKEYNKWLVPVFPELAQKNTEYQKKFLFTKTINE